MKLSSQQLSKQLKQGLSPIYVVSGDDTLLTQEAADLIRTACRAQDFTERQVFTVDTSFDWNTLLEASNSLSLFAERRLLELRLSSAKPGDKGAAALLSYLQNPASDTVLLVSLPRVDGTSMRSKWAKTLSESSDVQWVQVWPLEAQQLPQWLNQRLSNVGLSADPAAIDLIAHRVEGNLLAAAQEIDKLQLLVNNSHVTVEDIEAAVADSARYDVFGLLDATLSGQTEQSIHMLNGLKGEGVEPPVILWAVTREIRTLIALHQAQQNGVPLERAFSQQRPPIWDRRRPLISRALQRHSLRQLNALLTLAQHADAQIKGQTGGDVWSSLAELLCNLSGQALLLNHR